MNETPQTFPLPTLWEWSDQGWLRRLDSALAALARELDPAAEPAVLVAAALLAHMEGRGHTCLPLGPLADQDPQRVLDWPAPAGAGLAALWGRLPRGREGWVRALGASPLVRPAPGAPLAAGVGPAGPDLGQPFVLGGTPEGPLLYLRRYWRFETLVSASVLARAQTRFPVDGPVARAWLDRLFPPGETGAPDWQKAACAIALRRGLAIVTGGPGTGKTHTAARLLALLHGTHAGDGPLRVALAAPTGKAAARLRQSLDQSLESLAAVLAGYGSLDGLTRRLPRAQTLHALLGARPETRRYRFDAQNPLDLDCLILDETSMVNLELMAALLAALPETARLVLLGDKDQLASVEAGAVLGDLCAAAESGQYSAATAEYLGAVAGVAVPGALRWSGPGEAPPLAQQTVMLRHSHRFGGAIGRLAVAVNGAQHEAVAALLHPSAGAGVTDGAAVWLAPAGQVAPARVLEIAVGGRALEGAGPPGRTPCYADYLGLMRARPGPALTDAGAHAAWVRSVLDAFEGFRILCAVHEGDWGDRPLNAAVQGALAQAGLLRPQGDWFPGRPVMVTRNDPALGLSNGDVGVTLPGLGGGLRVWFADGEGLRSVGVSRLAHAETAFAMTVHKSQGSEFAHTLLVLSPQGGELMTRELIYTGLTRARRFLSIVEPAPGLLAAAIDRRSWRASGLQARLGPG